MKLNNYIMEKIKVKIPIQEGSEETIIITTTLEKFKEVYSS